MKVVITARNFDVPGCKAIQMLHEAGFETADHGNMGLSVGADESLLKQLVTGADAVICGLEPYRESLLSQCPEIKVLSRRGIGYDSVDLDACRRLGISVWRTFGAVEGSVAEQVMAYILYEARRIDLQNEPMHRHEWKRMMLPGAKGRTLGLVGFGGIGKEIAKRAVPFGMKVYYTCRHPDPAWEKQYGVTYLPMNELLAVSDYVSVNVPQTPATEGLIGAEQLAMMPEGSCLINIARSPVVDTDALCDALNSSHLARAYVDVYPHEPCTDSPLMDCPNAVLTPHTASYTQENFTAMNELAALNVIRFFRGDADEGCRLV